MKHLLLLSFSLLLVLSACFNDDTTMFDNESDWKVDMLLPMAYTTISLEELANIKKISTTVKITSAELNAAWAGILPALMPIQNLSTEPFAKDYEISEYFDRIYTKRVAVSTTFQNNYPIIIGKGSQLVFRNFEEKSIIYRHKIQHDVMPGETYEFTIEVTGTDDNPTLVESHIEFYLEDFRTYEVKSAIDFTNADTRFTFKLDFVNILRVVAKTEKLFEDTVHTSYTLDSISSQQIAEGKLKFYLENRLPFNVKVNIDFLDDQGNIKEKVFTNDLDVMGATINQTSLDIESFNLGEFDLDLTLDRQKLLLDGGKLLVYYNLNTLGVNGVNNTISAGQASNVKIQVVGDFNLNVSAISF